MKRFYAAFFFTLLVTSFGAIAIEPTSQPQEIHFLYEDYPPFFWHKKGRAEGSTVQKIDTILSRTNLKANWQLTTFARMMRTITDNHSATCIGGYSKTAAKEKLGWFSLPFAIAPQNAIAVRRDNYRLFQKYTSILDVLGDKTLHGGFLKGPVYDKMMQPHIDRGKSRHIFISGGDNDLATIVARGRVQFAPLNQAQITFYNDNTTETVKLVAVPMADIAPPRTLHIMCSWSLPEAIRDRIDAAISAKIKAIHAGQKTSP
jgi:uncharacterized protein (TIGR02285 family)